MRQVSREALTQDPALALWQAVHEGGIEIVADGVPSFRIEPVDGLGALPATLALWRAEFASL